MHLRRQPHTLLAAAKRVALLQEDRGVELLTLLLEGEQNGVFLVAYLVVWRLVSRVLAHRLGIWHWHGCIVHEWAYPLLDMLLRPSDALLHVVEVLLYLRVVVLHVPVARSRVGDAHGCSLLLAWSLRLLILLVHVGTLSLYARSARVSELVIFKRLGELSDFVLFPLFRVFHYICSI